GSKGYKKEAPYDKIIAAAAATGDVPVYWKRQLKIGGRIVAPVENSIIVIDKTGRNKYNQKEYFGFSFVPLITNN
ncbi:MAG: protein-L-isoaspartate O-methyltransferase, partial [Patescibacteria group bacterium]